MKFKQKQKQNQESKKPKHRKLKRWARRTPSDCRINWKIYWIWQFWRPKHTLSHIQMLIYVETFKTNAIVFHGTKVMMYLTSHWPIVSPAELMPLYWQCHSVRFKRKAQITNKYTSYRCNWNVCTYEWKIYNGKISK
jgi:hypothetical protein